MRGAAHVHIKEILYLMIYAQSSRGECAGRHAGDRNSSQSHLVLTFPSLLTLTIPVFPINNLDCGGPP